MRSDIHQLLSAEPTLLETDDLRRSLDEIIRWERRIVAARLRMLAELNRRNVWKHDGAGSAADWAATRLRSGSRTAREQVDIAEKLTAMPSTADAMAAGELSVEQVAALAAAVDDKTATDFRRDEAELVDTAKALPPGAVRRLADRWRRDHTSTADDDQRHATQVERRSGRVYTNPDGMTILQLESDPLSAAWLTRAITQRVEFTADALASFDEAVRLAPRFADAHCNRGVALQKLSKLQQIAQVGADGEAGQALLDFQIGREGGQQLFVGNGGRHGFQTTRYRT